MGRKRDSQGCVKDRVKAVLRLVQKDGPLSAKQKSFCDDACVERFLKARGNDVKKAAKQLRTCLAWRDALPIGHLIADEFSAELAKGIAFVAGRDDEARPVVIVRLKQDYQKFQSHKLYVRLLVFTLEVATASMLPGVEQCVLMFDAVHFRSASTCLNFIMATLKTSADYYPGRLAKVFVVDPPSMFNYLWKGIRPFTDFAAKLYIVSSRDYDSPHLRNNSPLLSGLTRTSSLRYDFSPNLGSSFRFSSKVASENVKFSLNGREGDRFLAHSIGPALISPFNARSFSFGSPALSKYNICDNKIGDFQSFRFEGTPGKNSFRHTPNVTTPSRSDWTPTHSSKASILSSPMTAFFHGFKKDSQRIESDRKEKILDCFRPYLYHYRLPYDEIVYRSMMKPPLGGLVSIVSPELKRGPTSDFRRNVYF